MAHLFAGCECARLYAKVRPSYTKELYDIIIKYCYHGNSRMENAVDIACGSGQSTFPLAPYFRHVTGTDINSDQVEQAKKLLKTKPDMVQKVNFEIGKGEDLSQFADRSLDLVSMGQAMHWIDTEKFYRETDRTLRVGGTLAIYGYGNVKLDNTAANDIVWEVRRVYTELCICISVCLLAGFLTDRLTDSFTYY